MDKFEKKMEELSQMSKRMSEDEVNKAIEEEKKICLCPGCPTYNDCMGGKNQALFCALGKSEGCEINKIQCLCPTCPVTDEYGLKFIFFCNNGSEQEQREKQHDLDVTTGGE
jgi:hypothetical protein